MRSAPAKGPYSRTISAARTGACGFVLRIVPRVRVIAWLLAALRDGTARPIYPSGSAAGSNKFVVNPASGGDSQRCARAGPIEPPPAAGAPAARREREAARAGLDARQRRGQRAQTADLDAQARPVRLVGAAGAERARDQAVPI